MSINKITKTVLLFIVLFYTQTSNSFAEPEVFNKRNCVSGTTLITATSNQIFDYYYQFYNDKRTAVWATVNAMKANSYLRTSKYCDQRKPSCNKLGYVPAPGGALNLLKINILREYAYSLKYKSVDIISIDADDPPKLGLAFDFASNDMKLTIITLKRVDDNQKASVKISATKMWPDRTKAGPPDYGLPAKKLTPVRLGQSDNYIIVSLPNKFFDPNMKNRKFIKNIVKFKVDGEGEVRYVAHVQRVDLWYLMSKSLGKSSVSFHLTEYMRGKLGLHGRNKNNTDMAKLFGVGLAAVISISTNEASDMIFNKNEDIDNTIKKLTTSSATLLSSLSPSNIPEERLASTIISNSMSDILYAIYEDSRLDDRKIFNSKKLTAHWALTNKKRKKEKIDNFGYFVCYKK